MDVPDHLSGVHKTLIQYGHAMWVKYQRDSDLKRNIRYDDVEMTLCLDIKFPGKKDWITVTHQRALRDRRASVSQETDSRGDLLSTAGQVIVQESEVDDEEQMEQGQSLNKGAQSAGGTITSTSWRAPRK